jgi:hypothetical protein
LLRSKRDLAIPLKSKNNAVPRTKLENIASVARQVDREDTATEKARHDRHIQDLA